MSALQILKSFIDVEYDPVTWAYVTYTFNYSGYEDQDFFWERSRSNITLKSDIFPGVPAVEKRIYKEPFHAEKYILRRLRIKLNHKNKPRGGRVYILLNKSPCIIGSKKYKSCLNELRDFSSDFKYIDVKVKYVLDKFNNARAFNDDDDVDNLSIFPCDIRNWRFLVRRIIHLLNQEHFGDTSSIKRRLHGIRRKEGVGVKEMRYVLENILKEHY